MDKVLLSWSGGKDSALALMALRQSAEYEVVALLTTLTADGAFIPMHRIHRTLLEQQAAALGLPLEPLCLAPDGLPASYAAQMQRLMERYRAQGVSTVASGDILLADLRRYREQNLAQAGMRAVFPLWQQDTATLAQRFVRLGFKAVLSSIDAQALDPAWLGRTLDAQFLAALPAGVDPCGERGEYHSFVYAGPLFPAPIPYQLGPLSVVEQRFYARDLLPPQEATRE